IDMSYDQLVEYSAQVFKEVRRRAYGEGYRQGKFDAEMDANENKSKTPEIGDRLKQAKRDHIVAQSKADLEYLKGGYKNRWYQADGVFDCEADFIVNREKRTVVVLLRGVGSGVIRAKGIAKCAPNDCFNVHIGKAIALRRALGLKATSDYLDAPQPPEVCVRDVLEYEGYRDTVNPSGGIFNHRREGTCSVGSYVSKPGKIIDGCLVV